MSSGTSRISWITVPAFSNRLFSSFSLSPALAANDIGASISAPAKIAVIRFINLSSILSFLFRPALGFSRDPLASWLTNFHAGRTPPPQSLRPAPAPQELEEEQFDDALPSLLEWVQCPALSSAWCTSALDRPAPKVQARSALFRESSFRSSFLRTFPPSTQSAARRRRAHRLTSGEAGAPPATPETTPGK